MLAHTTGRHGGRTSRSRLVELGNVPHASSFTLSSHTADRPLLAIFFHTSLLSGSSGASQWRHRHPRPGVPVGGPAAGLTPLPQPLLLLPHLHRVPDVRAPPVVFVVGVVAGVGVGVGARGH